MSTKSSWASSDHSTSSTQLPSLFQQAIHTRHRLVVGQARFLAVNGLLHLGAKPAVIAVGLLLGLELGDAGVQGGGVHGRTPWFKGCVGHALNIPFGAGTSKTGPPCPRRCPAYPLSCRATGATFSRPLS